jgi:uncharacterized membrane protein
VFVWYLATSVAAVWFVFRDPAFDYRLLLVGSVLPLADAVTGGVWVMHSITFSVALVALVMAVTVGRRSWRRRFLPLPIGTMMYLVFSGAWANADAFWWPFSGWEVDDASLPMVERGWGWSISLELAGVLIAVWIWRTTRLADHTRRRQFASTGRLDFVVH